MLTDALGVQADILQHANEYPQGAAEYATAASRVLRGLVPDDPSEEAVHVSPPKLRDAALYGLAGEFVRLTEPYSESDPAALLVQFLVAFGNMIGRAPFFYVAAMHHYGNLAAVIVGDTASARKGTSWAEVRSFMKQIDPVWHNTRVKSGLSTGEGLIAQVQDPIHKMVYNKKTGETVETEVEPGVDDKRLLCLETEFSSTLQRAEKDNSSLSQVMRDAWDGSILSTLTRNNALKATGSHVSLIGHITMPELKKTLSDTQVSNGFANRILWTFATSSKLIPRDLDRNMDAITALAEQVALARMFAYNMGHVRWAADTAKEWDAAYTILRCPRPGQWGAMTARAEAQATRLAMLYAVLDGKALIEPDHLHAALALWQYAQDTVRYVFGDSLGDPTADELARGLRGAGTEGMTRWQINDFFGGHCPKGKLDAALALLESAGLAHHELQSGTGGRPSTTWFSGGPFSAKNASNGAGKPS